MSLGALPPLRLQYSIPHQHEYDIKHQHKVSKTENRLSLKHTHKKILVNMNRFYCGLEVGSLIQQELCIHREMKMHVLGASMCQEEEEGGV